MRRSGRGLAISAGLTAGPPIGFQAERASVGVRSLNHSWAASVTARTCPCFSASRTLCTQPAPLPGFPSLAQAAQCPPGVFCRARQTVESMFSGLLTAKTSISPLWPSEAVNEVMGDMPCRPFRGVLSGRGDRSGAGPAARAEGSVFSPRL